MSEEELRRTGVMSRVAAGVLKLVKEAELLRVSYRQAKRLWRRYRDKEIAAHPPGCGVAPGIGKAGGATRVCHEHIAAELTACLAPRVHGSLTESRVRWRRVRFPGSIFLNRAYMGVDN
jgi:hypothetical protein